MAKKLASALLASVWLLAAHPGAAQTEPPHPIMPVPGNAAAAEGILSTYTEAQFLQFVPTLAPRGANYGFVPAVVSGDTGWSWSASAPNQLTSTPSGTVFPNSTHTIRFEAVPVLSGRTVNVPFYDAASGNRKSLVFGEINLRKRNKIRPDLLALAAAYVQSGASPATRDGRFARRVAVALDSWATAVPDYYMTQKNSANFISAAGFTTLTSDIQRSSDHNGLAHEWGDDELQAFDAIYDSPALSQLSAERGYDVRDHIRRDLFFNIGDFIKDRVPISVAIATNLSGPFNVLAQVARVLNRPDYILWMDDYLDDTVRRKVMRDGTLPEGLGYSYGYVNENLSAARHTRDYFSTRPADTAQLAAIRDRAVLYVERLQSGLDRQNALRLPNGQLASFGDTPFNSITARNAGVSGLLPAYGHAVMGTGTGAQALQVNQNFSDDGNHMRADVTGYTLWALGVELLGNIRYHNGTPGRQFTEQILAYNAVTIDRVNMSRDSWRVGNSNHRFTSGNLTLYEPGNAGIAVTEVDGQRAYANKASRYQRLLVLNTVDANRPYLVDVFRVTGGLTHDYTFHGSIRFDSTWQSSLPLTVDPDTHPMLEGSETWVEPATSGSSFPYYGFWRNVSSGPAAGNFQITYRDASASHRDVRLWMTDGGAATVYQGRTPVPERVNGEPPSFYKYWRPSLIVRRRISAGVQESLFAGVVEPLASGASTIQSVSRVPIAGGGLEAVALRVTFTDGRVDTLVLNLNNPRVAGVPAGGAATVSTADGRYVLAGRVGLHTRGPAGERAWTLAGSSLQVPGARLTTPNTFFQGTITDMLREAAGDSGNAFVTSASLPAGTALRRRQLALVYDTYRVVDSTAVQRGISEMFEIDRVETVGGQSVIHLTRDHQLTMAGETVREGVAPERTFEGPVRFEVALGASGVPTPLGTPGGTFEAETLARAATSGDPIVVNTESGASAGRYILVQSNATGDFVKLTVPNLAAGTYNVRIGVKKNTNRAIVQTLVGRVGGSLGNLGAPMDLFGPSAFVELNLGNWTPGSTSDKHFQFQVSGKNATSSGRFMAIDYIKLVRQ